MVEGVSDGVVHAAGLCHALTLTNGLDAGVVGAIGSVHDRQQYKWDGPLIGVVASNSSVVLKAATEAHCRAQARLSPSP